MSKRTQYIEKMKARLDQWDAEIGKLEAKVEELKADARIEYQKQIQEVRRHRDEAYSKVKELQNASDEAWGDVASGFDNAWGNIVQSIETAMSRFRR
jgi:chromosome segregation ATPase